MTDKPTRGNPPVSGRFRKGQSGNLKGRPKSKAVTPTSSAIEVILDKTLTVNRDGKPREISVEEALQQHTLQQALDGNRSAQREVLKWIIRRDKHLAAENRRKAPKAVTVRYTDDPGNADEALLLLGITALDPKRQDYRSDRPQMLLEPWAVQTALSRRRGGKKLSKEEISAIRRCTRDPDSLRWPKGIEE
ncbi:MAG: hypothetical protein CMN56_09660 [Sneathiella sp.]|uniref:DUF5681 domain-containing protein n=1 Tax=Sneathiella sp. TaxID=1964365 RepID=UPI000C517916|nr:DUF5681 domain-containing protein [Sneathiella sp.]MAZ03393.1 hypothetical protein [Sneathiella sp.]|tara:strand:+ start:119 stop:691 length:573 start_codon:yes stop_codon:yes gene_type:complete